jgi:hypothetical protein
MHSSINDPFLDADDLNLGSAPGGGDYDLLTSADEDVILSRQSGAYGMRHSDATYGTTTPPSIINATSESPGSMEAMEDYYEPPTSSLSAMSLRAAPLANLRVLLRAALSAKGVKITIILLTLFFAIGCLMSRAEVEEERHLIGLSAAVPIISFPNPSLSLSTSLISLLALRVAPPTLTLLPATC